MVPNFQISKTLDDDTLVKYPLVNLHNYGTSFFMGKLAISMAMFNSCVTFTSVVGVI